MSPDVIDRHGRLRNKKSPIIGDLGAGFKLICSLMAGGLRAAPRLETPPR